MFEVNPEIIDANELLYRVETSVIKNKVPQKYFGMDISQPVKSVEEREMERLLVSIRDKLAWLREAYAIREIPIQSNRPIIGKFIVIVKKVYRKLTRWIFASYYQQQTVINGTMMQTMTEMMELQELLIATYDKKEKGE